MGLLFLVLWQRMFIRGCMTVNVCRNRNLINQAEAVKFRDPCVELQKSLTSPMFTANETPFQPSVETMKSAACLFLSSRTHEIKFLKSFLDVSDAPTHELPEILFIGRSNVGKSSLIQALFHTVPNLVRISKKPGLTKTINCFQVGKRFCLIDVPGYGFRQPQYYTESVETYMQHRPNLVRTFLLIDSKVGFCSWDFVGLEMLEEFGIPYALILTKIDKTVDSRLIRNLMDLQEIRNKKCTPSCFPQPLLVSAQKGDGIGYLMAFIAHITGQLPHI